MTKPTKTALFAAGIAAASLIIEGAAAEPPCVLCHADPRGNADAGGYDERVLEDARSGPGSMAPLWPEHRSPARSAIAETLPGGIEDGRRYGSGEIL